MADITTVVPSSKTAFSRAAPPYDPLLWNGRVSDQDLLAFRDLHMSVLERIHAVERDLPVSEAKGHLTVNPDGAVSSSVALFNKLVEEGLNNKEIATKFGLSETEVADFRRPALDFYLGQGFKRYANCYTYAMNDPDRYSFLGDAPGERVAGTPRDNAKLREDMARVEAEEDYDGFKKNLLLLVESDGAIIGGPSADPIDGYYRVAVYTSPPHKGRKSESDPWSDYHFVRENDDGTWSHKPGSGSATNIDKSGELMTDPKTANIGNYEFVTFVYVPEGGLDVGPSWEPASKKASIQNPPDPEEDWKRKSAAPFPEIVASP